MSRDTFGRIRTTNSFTLYNYYPTPLTSSRIDDDILTKYTNGSGTVSYNSSNYIGLTCNLTGDNVLVQSKQPMEYLSGKSQLIYITGVLLSRILGGTIGEVFVSRMGLYNVDESDKTIVTEGIYIETDGQNTIRFVDVTQNGSTSVNQIDWNIDVFDGTGVSGKTIDMNSTTKVMLIFIERAWLGVGCIKVGFVIDGVHYYAHTFSHVDSSIQYTKTPRQLISYQLVTQQLNSSIFSRMMCFTNISEGGYFPLGRRNSINTSMSGVELGTTGTKYLLLALKVDSSYKTGTIKPIHLSVTYHAGAGTLGLYELHLFTSSKGTTSSLPSSSTLTNSIVNYYVGNGTCTLLTDGYKLTSGFVSTNSNVIFSSNDFETLLHRTICTANDGDILCLFATGNGNNDIMYASLDFIESL